MKKRGRIHKNTEISSNSSSLSDDKDIESIKNVIQRLKQKYHLSTTDILNYSQEDILIPCSIFNNNLSPLETVVKYLKENLGLKFSRIGELLGRSSKTVWQAYKNSSKKKLDSVCSAEESEYSIPISSINADLSLLESIVSYLRSHFNLSYHQISLLLKRDERTIWTVYSRAKKKLKHAS
ncbi:hypothetical protein GF336_05380 [Candidatus Woesearchaeota archaeon]|nr:hypothetical protein [Candidatus Woesearchaeota archaeon]